jgi:hypothetical protein
VLGYQTLAILSRRQPGLGWRNCRPLT